MDGVWGLDGGEGLGGKSEAGVVVEEVEDLDWGAIGKVPLCGVELPGLVRQLGLKADEGGLGALMGLGSNELVALEDPPYGGG
jgi:hypothetical protein